MVGYQIVRFGLEPRRWLRPLTAVGGPLRMRCMLRSPYRRACVDSTPFTMRMGPSRGPMDAGAGEGSRTPKPFGGRF